MPPKDKVQSGTSLDKPTRISKRGNRYLRLALYMPALTAASRDEHAQALHRELVERGKRPMQAIVVVMRKLLHAIHAMFRTNQPYDGRKAFRAALRPPNAPLAEAC